MKNDIISRQEAIDAMDTWDKFGCNPDGRLVRFDDNKHYVPYVRYDDMVYVIKSLPSAQPERKTGKWKGYNADNPKWLRDDGSPVFLKCSACNTIVMNNGSAYWNFCPNCGADMRGEQDGSD